MRLAFDATTLDPRMSGVGYYTARLLESLANGAGDAHLSAVTVVSNREVPVTSGGRLEVFTARRFPIRSIWMQAVLPGILRKVRPDVVHFTNYLAPLLMPAPYVVSVHDMTLSLMPGHHTLKKRLLTSSLIPTVARRARLVLAPSESTRRDVVRILGLDPGRVRVIPYAPGPLFRPSAVDPASMSSRWGIERPYFLSVGTLEPRKNVPRVMRAFARVAPALPDHSLVLVGARGWKCEEVFAELGRPALARRVRVLDYVPEEDLPGLYTHAVCLVYASLYEGFGFPVVEAMACGTPVLTSLGSSLQEIGEGAALLVDPTREDEIAEGLLSLARDAGLRSRLRTQGLTRAAQFSWERTGRETVAAYREAAGSP
jgi:glycosyltransferase involved in cell wall biosynthesis